MFVVGGGIGRDLFGVVWGRVVFGEKDRRWLGGLD